MKKMQKFVVPVNIICYGEDALDAVTYVEEALDSSSFITEDGIIGAEVLADDTELFEEGYDDDEREYDDEED
jgi:hypothetical protein